MLETTPANSAQRVVNHAKQAQNFVLHVITKVYGQTSLKVCVSESALIFIQKSEVLVVSASHLAMPAVEKLICAQVVTAQMVLSTDLVTSA